MNTLKFLKNCLTKNRFIKKLAGKTSLSIGTPDIFSHIKAGDVVIDCRANIGEVTAVLAARGPLVYAFEPNPFAFAELQKRFMNVPHVKCFNKAVWDKNSTVKLFLHIHSDADQIKWSTGSSLLDIKSNVSKEKYVEIESVDLSEFIEHLDTPVAFVKMDVEGVEVDIINRLIDTGVIHRIEKMVVETHENKIPELKHKTDMLKKRIRDQHLAHKINLNWI
jgi:FkbM family methyltransferase